MDLEKLVEQTVDLDELVVMVKEMIKSGTPRSAIKDHQYMSWNHQFGIENAKEKVAQIYDENKSLFGFEDMNNYQKIKALIDEKFKIIYNEVTMKYYFKVKGGQEWELYTDLPIYDYLKDHCGIAKVSDKDIASAMDTVCTRENPIKKYFEQLPKWDGKTDYIQKFVDCFETNDQKFFYEMLKKNIVRSIKCAIESDYENRYLMIFVGGQQSGKTKAIQFLNPFYEDRGFGKYHSHAPLKMGDKDSIIQSSSVFLYNLEEFEQLKGKELSHMKQVISQGNTMIRPPYGKFDVEVERRCTYYASTNKSEFLSDTENTRYLPIHLFNNKDNQINWKKYTKSVKGYEYPVDAIYSQALALYNDENFVYELTGEERAWQEEQNKAYNVTTYSSEAVKELYKAPSKGDSVQYLTLTDIKKDVDSLMQGDRHATNQYQIKDTLLQIGIEYKQYWVGDKNIGYKYAVHRLREGDENFIPKYTGTWE